MKKVEQTEMIHTTKGGEKMKKLNNKLLKNNKGFSLVELLIVIAIMGVLAVIAFNMFGGVLASSKKKADEQMAQNIQKALITYCIDSNDWSLTDNDKSLSTLTGIELVTALTSAVTVDGETYGPYFTLKDPEADGGADAAVNQKALSPQWNANSGGTYVGWNITIYKGTQNVTCSPVGTEDPVVTVEE